MTPHRRVPPFVLAITLLAGLVAAQWQALPPRASAAVGCPPNWARVASPNPRSSNSLESVYALSDDDVWAVGYMFDFAATPDVTLTMHWNGTEWRHIESPNPAAGSYLEDVTAFAPDDVWAVGYHFGNGQANTLTMHWDGAAWTIVPSPNQPPNYNELNAIDGVAPDDIWAVGTTPSTHNTVTLHWDGDDWSVVPSLPNDFSSEYVIADIEAIASDDVWVVGARFSSGVQRKNFAMHWNGSSWQQVALPNQSLYFSDLTGIVAVSEDEVYAVGSYTLDSGATYLTQILKYNGTSWSQLPSPNGSDSGYNRLEDVTLGADGELWAVGYWHFDNFPSFPANSLVLRYQGTGWSAVSSPNGNYFNSHLYGIAASPEGDLWAVGRSFNYYNTPWESLILRNDCPIPQPTATPSPTVPAPTPSPTLAAPTPTPSPTTQRLYLPLVQRDASLD